MTLEPAALLLVVPFMLLVLLYFQRKRRHEQIRVNVTAAERLAAADPARQLQELIQIELDEEPDETRTSFKAFLKGAPTRWLSAGLIAEVYHAAIGVVVLGVAAVFIIRDAIANPIVAYVLVALVLVPLGIAWALRTNRGGPASGRVHDALARVLLLQNLQYGAVIDRTWRVIATAGEIDRLEDADLAELLLGRHGEAMRTYQALDWMPLPQVVTMEQTEAIADKPSSTLVVVVFRQRNATFDDSGHHIASISRAIHEEFGKSS